MLNYLTVALILVCGALSANAWTWPVPYQRYDSRPTNDPYCQAGLVPFCPTGKTVDAMPVMDAADTIEVFALKKPVWSFKYGPLMGYLHVMHDGMGIRNTRTGQNYTLEWYELDQIFNCTFPHIVEKDNFIWCNQGALCIYEGINDTVWTEYSGIVAKVTEMTGTQFNQFANWSVSDNNTAIYYETWSVYNTDDEKDKSLTMYFDSFDCASWVLRAFDQLYALGARFDQKVELNYTRLNMYSQEPICLGNYSQIAQNNQTLLQDIIAFYKEFQKQPNTIEQLIEIYEQFELRQKFYIYYNNMYWLLNLKKPFVKISYFEEPLPGTTLYKKKKTAHKLHNPAIY